MPMLLFETEKQEAQGKWINNNGDLFSITQINIIINYKIIIGFHSIYFGLHGSL